MVFYAIKQGKTQYFIGKNEKLKFVAKNSHKLLTNAGLDDIIYKCISRLIYAESHLDVRLYQRLEATQSVQNKKEDTVCYSERKLPCFLLRRSL